ncbi:MAG: formate acetyltransferase, partial [Lentisphaerae bacterium]|nr:formate acetyltransferase [Lentisphaerota bacterium]
MNYPERMANLRRRKAEQTAAKLRQLGIRNEDDYGCVLPPADFKVELPCRDENGSFFGAYAWGKNFRWLMEHHPAYIDPDDALAGRWMFMLSRMRLGYKLELANFPFDYSHLKPEQIKYDITCGIGKDAHFAPDYEIGLQLGWGGLLEKAHAAREQFAENPEARELFDAEIDAIEGVQCWVRHLAEAADKKSRSETDPVLRNNLESMAAINYKLIASPPETLREA